MMQYNISYWKVVALLDVAISIPDRPWGAKSTIDQNENAPLVRAGRFNNGSERGVTPSLR